MLQCEIKVIQNTTFLQNHRIRISVVKYVLLKIANKHVAKIKHNKVLALYVEGALFQ